MILRYREVEKLRGTYGAPLIDAVQTDGRIHATFNQTVARTGRLSSDGPNLHNIPVRSEEADDFASLLPSEGWEMAVSDYNQIELRDRSRTSPRTRACSRPSRPTRTCTARSPRRSSRSRPTDVYARQREQAKAVSYGLAYGMEAFGLAGDSESRSSEAKEIMDKYFIGVPALRSYMDQTITDIRARATHAPSSAASDRSPTRHGDWAAVRPPSAKL